MSDQTDPPDQETPPADEAEVPPPPEAEPVVEPPPPTEDDLPPPEEAPPEEVPPPEEAPPAEVPPPEEAPPEEVPPPEEAPPEEEPPGEAPPEVEPEEELAENVEPVSDDASQAVEPVPGDAPSESSPEEAKPEEGGDEQVLSPATSRPEDGGGESRRESTVSEIRALTTQQILERLQKSYTKACKTLEVIGDIQRRESVLKLEDHQMELIKKFTKFESHLEQLGLATEMETQTSKHSCEDKSVPGDEWKPQDLLPQVIICGREERQGPKIIVCDSYKKASNKRSPAQREIERLLKIEKELNDKCELMNEKLIMKESIVACLRKQVCNLQKENCMLRCQLSKSGQTPPAREVSQEIEPVPGTETTPQVSSMGSVRVCSVCSPCPNLKGNLPAVKEESPSSDVGQENQADRTSQHVCPSRCPCFKANLPVVKEESVRVCSVCSPCPNLKGNFPAIKEESPSSDAGQENQADRTSQHVCPCFKANLPVVKEESTINNENVCPTTCPYFHINVPTTEECRENAKTGPDITNNEIEEEEEEVEIQEQSLEGSKGIIPLDCKKEQNGEVCQPCSKKEDGKKGQLCICIKPQMKPLTCCELQELTALKKDSNDTMSELTTLRKKIVKYKEVAEQACVAQEKAEIELKNMSKKIKSMEDMMTLVPKEQMMEMEQQIIVAKERFTESQDELEELRELTERQTTELEDYRSRFMQSHELVEEQKGQIELLELEISRINENVALEIQHLKKEFEVRLQALAPLPDLLKATQEKLVELQQQHADTERRCEDLEKELELANEKMREYEARLGDEGSELREEMKKVAMWEEKYNLLQQENADLKEKIEEMEETESNQKKRLMEKLHEVAQLAATLEMLRVESARQVSRAKERVDSVYQTLQARVVNLEQQVAESRAAATTARKDREKIRQGLMGQIDSLNENFEKAQITIRTLQEQVGFFNDNN